MPRPRKEGSPVRRLTIALPESLEAAVLAVNQALAVPVSRMLDLIREDLEIRLCGCPEAGYGYVDQEPAQRAAIANLVAMIEADDIARREEAKQKLGLGPRRVTDQLMDIAREATGLVSQRQIDQAKAEVAKAGIAALGYDDVEMELRPKEQAPKIIDLMEALKASLASAPEHAARGVGDLSSVPGLQRADEVSPRLAHMFEEDREPATVEDAEGHQGVVVDPTDDELAPVVQMERREVER